MLFFVFIMANIAWMSYQQSYLDVKELKTLRALPAKLAKRNASLVKAEARVKELEAELAKLKQENQAARSPGIKSPTVAVKAQKTPVPKAQNWFSEQWALYSFLKHSFKCSPERQKYWDGLEKQVKAATAKADEVTAATQEQTVRLSAAETQVKELKAQVAKNTAEAVEAAEARAKGLTAQITNLEDFKQQFTGAMLESVVTLDNNARELGVSQRETQAQIKELKAIHGGMEVQINQLKAQLMEIMSEQSKQIAKGLAHQPSVMKAEDRPLCPEEPKRTGGQENDVSQLENVTGKRRDQSCVAVAEEVKRLEVAEKKVEEERLKAEREQRQSNFAVAIQEDYDVV